MEIMSEKKSKGHNSAENYSTEPKFKHHLHSLMTRLYTVFQFKMTICDGDNEWKLKIMESVKSKGHNSAENYLTRLSFELNLCILVTSRNWIRNDGGTEICNTICPSHFHGRSIKKMSEKKIIKIFNGHILRTYQLFLKSAAIFYLVVMDPHAQIFEWDWRKTNEMPWTNIFSSVQPNFPGLSRVLTFIVVLYLSSALQVYLVRTNFNYCVWFLPRGQFLQLGIEFYLFVSYGGMKRQRVHV